MRKVCVFLVALFAAGSGHSETCNPPFVLGASTNNSDDKALFEKTYMSFEQLMGAPPQVTAAAVDYRMPRSGWIDSAKDQARSLSRSMAKSAAPAIGIPMFSTAESTTVDHQLLAFANGGFDPVLAGIVSAYAQEGYRELYIRLGWEMNIPGTPTYIGDSPRVHSDWVSAFRHMYSALHAAADAAKVDLWVIWNPGMVCCSGVQPLTMLYPGDQYVDIIGFDIYADAAPFADSAAPYTYHNWHTGGEDESVAAFVADPVNRRHYWEFPAANKWTEDGSNGFRVTLDTMIDFARSHNKPLAIAEAGAGNATNGADVADDDAFPPWLADRLRLAQLSGVQIPFVLIWDSGGGESYEFSNPDDNKPKEAAAWRKYFGVICR